MFGTAFLILIILSKLIVVIDKKNEIMIELILNNGVNTNRETKSTIEPII